MSIRSADCKDVQFPFDFTAGFTNVYKCFQSNVSSVLGSPDSSMKLEGVDSSGAPKTNLQALLAGNDLFLTRVVRSCVFGLKICATLAKVFTGKYFLTSNC